MLVGSIIGAEEVVELDYVGAIEHEVSDSQHSLSDSIGTQADRAEPNSKPSVMMFWPRPRTLRLARDSHSADW